MKRFIYLIGLPGTGKTTLVHRFMEGREWKPDRPVKLLDTMVNGDTRILGRYYDGETYCGTDRLSMAVGPRAIEYLNQGNEETIIGEGDRLNRGGVFYSAIDNGFELHILHLKITDQERIRRYKLRNSTQSEQFIKSCRTKIKNICNEFGGPIFPKKDTNRDGKGFVTEFMNETPEDTEQIIEFISGVRLLPFSASDMSSLSLQ